MCYTTTRTRMVAGEIMIKRVSLLLTPTQPSIMLINHRTSGYGRKRQERVGCWVLCSCVQVSSHHRDKELVSRTAKATFNGKRINWAQTKVMRNNNNKCSAFFDFVVCNQDHQGKSRNPRNSSRLMFPGRMENVMEAPLRKSSKEGCLHTSCRMQWMVAGSSLPSLRVCLLHAKNGEY